METTRSASVRLSRILAFMGAIQLRQFGAQIYVADLVGLGMTREMGAVMTGIIMAGRTGAAFAAQVGTMQVKEGWSDESCRIAHRTSATDH